MKSRSPVPHSLFERKTTQSVAGILRIWLTIFFAWSFVITFWNPLTILAGILLIGIMQYHLNVLGHDGLHYLLSPNRQLNDLFCRWALHGPHCAPLTSMRANHLNHHKHVGDASDLDRHYYEVTRFRSGRAFGIWLLAALIGGMTASIATKLLVHLRCQSKRAKISSSRASMSTQLVDITSVLISQVCIFAALYWASGRWISYLILWILPLLTVMTGLNVIRSCLEHAEDTEADSPTRNYSFVSNPIERFFVAPFNMNIHAEHHRFPGVPWYKLPELRRHLQLENKYDDITLCQNYLERYLIITRFLDEKKHASGNF